MASVKNTDVATADRNSMIAEALKMHSNVHNWKAVVQSLVSIGYDAATVESVVADAKESVKNRQDNDSADARRSADTIVSLLNSADATDKLLVKIYSTIGLASVKSVRKSRDTDQKSIATIVRDIHDTLRDVRPSIESLASSGRIADLLADAETAMQSPYLTLPGNRPVYTIVGAFLGFAETAAAIKKHTTV